MQAYLFGMHSRPAFECDDDRDPFQPSKQLSTCAPRLAQLVPWPLQTVWCDQANESTTPWKINMEPTNHP